MMPRLTKAQQAELDEEVAHAHKVLSEMLKPDDEIATVTIHGLGSTDWVECFVGDGQKVERITYYVARVIGRSLSDKGIAVTGYGYSKSHDVVDSLSRKLFGEGYKLTNNRMMG